MNGPAAEVQPPARPRLAVRVGVTGHRAPRLEDADFSALRSRIRAVLAALGEAAHVVHARPGQDYSPEGPVLTIVSSLASGSDCIVAAEAVAMGYTLQAPLPFARAEYRRDLETDAQRAEFDRLVGVASAVLELDGDRSHADAAYERASAVMLDQCDVLLAIWDGTPSPRVGGTAHTVRQALLLEIPVLRIDSAAPHELRDLGVDGASTVAVEDLGDTVAHVLARQFPPLADPDDPLRQSYFTEPARMGRGVGVFRRFRALMEMGARRHEASGVDAPDHDAASGTLAAAPASLQAEHERADALAQHYAARYRDAFTANYLMGALAVLAALIGFVSPIGTITELVLIAAILLVIHRARRGRWHERWLGYRLCAEQLRQLALLRPLGRSVPAVRLPAHAAESDPSRLWTSWLTRARTREIGLASGAVTHAQLRAYRAELHAILRGQIAYHRNASHRSHVLAHRLHLAGTSLFYATLLVCIAHLGLEAWHHSHPVGVGAVQGSGPDPYSMNGALTLLAAVFPAFGAAFAGIASQGELHRVAQRSRAMSQQLDALVPRLAASAESSDAYASVAVDGVEIMTAELLDWQATFRAKPVVLPA